MMMILGGFVLNLSEEDFDINIGICYLLILSVLAESKYTHAYLF